MDHDHDDDARGIHFSVALFDHAVDIALETVCAPPPQHQIRGRRFGDDPLYNHDAVAEIAVSAKDLRKVFRFKTRRLLDFVNEGQEKVAVEYHVFSSRWPRNLNLAQARVVENAVVHRTQHGSCFPNAEMTLAHDYLRHVAKHVFNTPYGVQLFQNQRSVLGEIERICRSANVFKHVLDAIDSRTGAYYDDLPAPQPRFLTPRDQSSMNVGLALMRQILALQPNRLLEMPDKHCSSEGGDDDEVSHPIPLRPNDSLALTITLHAAKGQNDIFLCRRVDPIPPRTYCVRLILR